MLRLVDRYYQKEAIHGGSGYPGIYKVLKEQRAAIVTLATGTGKTIVFNKVIETCVERGRGALLLAHREELIEGSYDKLISATSIDHLQVGVEMASDRAGDHCSVVVGSVPALKGDRLRRLDPSRFGLIVIDECHHSVAASYQKIIDHFPNAKILGVTATADRLDGKGLGRIFGKQVAYDYSIKRAVEDGYLVPLVGEIVPGGEPLDFSGVRPAGGDLNQGDLAAIMERDPAVAVVAKGAVDRAGDRPTIIFTVSIVQARATADYINSYLRLLGRPPAAVALDGNASREERRNAKKRFERGEIQFLVNCALYTEGVDIPSVACVAIARPTKSRGLYCQMIGRSTRLLGATIEESIAAGKENSLVIDFTGNSGRHDLVTLVDALGMDSGDEVRRRVKREAAGGRVAVLEQLSLVSEEIMEEQRQTALKAAQYRVIKMADPFSIVGANPRPGRYGRKPATAAQLQTLAKNKMPGAAEQLARLELGTPQPQEPYDWGQARELVWRIAKRAREGKCSVRMGTVLAKHGLNPDVGWDKARWALDQIAGNGWKPTEAVLADSDLAVQIGP